MGMAHTGNSVANIVYNNDGNKASTMPGLLLHQLLEIIHVCFLVAPLHAKKQTKSFMDPTEQIGTGCNPQLFHVPDMEEPGWSK